MKSKIILFLFFASFLSASAQNKTTFGLQYKPIIPTAYFNSSDVSKGSEEYSFNLTPKYSNSFGMVIRQKINAPFSIESGLNYIQKNHKLSVSNNAIGLDDYSAFGMRSYEFPLQVLTYVRASEYWYLNVAFGISHNVLASDIFSEGDKLDGFYQNTYRKNGGYRALLANIGMEYRTEEKGYYYLGASLHRPWGEIGRIYPEYKKDEVTFNDENFNDMFFIDMLGTFVTIDLRYFFVE